MQRLSDHFAAGRLSVAEFDERSAVVAAAVTRGDLVKVFEDLPEPVSDTGPVPERPPHRGRPEFRGPAMGLIVILALVLFFTTQTWLWFLLIPAAGIVFGALGHGREQRRHGVDAEEHRLGIEDHRREIQQQRRELRRQAREMRHQHRDRRER